MDDFTTINLADKETMDFYKDNNHTTNRINDSKKNTRSTASNSSTLVEENNWMYEDMINCQRILKNIENSKTCSETNRKCSKNSDEDDEYTSCDEENIALLNKFYNVCDPFLTETIFNNLPNSDREFAKNTNDNRMTETDNDYCKHNDEYYRNYQELGKNFDDKQEWSDCEENESDKTFTEQSNLKTDPAKIYYLNSQGRFVPDGWLSEGTNNSNKDGDVKCNYLESYLDADDCEKNEDASSLVASKPRKCWNETIFSDLDKDNIENTSFQYDNTPYSTNGSIDSPDDNDIDILRKKHNKNFNNKQSTNNSKAATDYLQQAYPQHYQHMKQQPFSRDDWDDLENEQNIEEINKSFQNYLNYQQLEQQQFEEDKQKSQHEIKQDSNGYNDLYSSQKNNSNLIAAFSELPRDNDFSFLQQQQQQLQQHLQQQHYAYSLNFQQQQQQKPQEQQTPYVDLPCYTISNPIKTNESDKAPSETTNFTPPKLPAQSERNKCYDFQFRNSRYFDNESRQPARQQKHEQQNNKEQQYYRVNNNILQQLQNRLKLMNNTAGNYEARQSKIQVQQPTILSANEDIGLKNQPQQQFFYWQQKQQRNQQKSEQESKLKDRLVKCSRVNFAKDNANKSYDSLKSELKLTKLLSKSEEADQKKEISDNTKSSNNDVKTEKDKSYKTTKNKKIGQKLDKKQTTSDPDIDYLETLLDTVKLNLQTLGQRSSNGEEQPLQQAITRLLHNYQVLIEQNDRFNKRFEQIEKTILDSAAPQDIKKKALKFNEGLSGFKKEETLPASNKTFDSKRKSKTSNENVVQKVFKEENEDDNEEEEEDDDDEEEEQDNDENEVEDVNECEEEEIKRKSTEKEFKKSKNEYVSRKGPKNQTAVSDEDEDDCKINEKFIEKISQEEKLPKGMKKVQVKQAWTAPKTRFSKEECCKDTYTRFSIENNLDGVKGTNEGIKYNSKRCTDLSHYLKQLKVRDTCKACKSIKSDLKSRCEACKNRFLFSKYPNQPQFTSKPLCKNCNVPFDPSFPPPRKPNISQIPDDSIENFKNFCSKTFKLNNTRDHSSGGTNRTFTSPVTSSYLDNKIASCCPEILSENHLMKNSEQITEKKESSPVLNYQSVANTGFLTERRAFPKKQTCFQNQKQPNTQKRQKQLFTQRKVAPNFNGFTDFAPLDKNLKPFFSSSQNTWNAFSSTLKHKNYKDSKLFNVLQQTNQQKQRTYTSLDKSPRNKCTFNLINETSSFENLEVEKDNNAFAKFKNIDKTEKNSFIDNYKPSKSDDKIKGISDNKKDNIEKKIRVKADEVKRLYSELKDTLKKTSAKKNDRKSNKENCEELFFDNIGSKRSETVKKSPKKRASCCDSILDTMLDNSTDEVLAKCDKFLNRSLKAEKSFTKKLKELNDSLRKRSNDICDCCKDSEKDDDLKKKAHEICDCCKDLNKYGDTNETIKKEGDNLKDLTNILQKCPCMQEKKEEILTSNFDKNAAVKKDFVDQIKVKSPFKENSCVSCKKGTENNKIVSDTFTCPSKNNTVNIVFNDVKKPYNIKNLSFLSKRDNPETSDRSVTQRSQPIEAKHKMSNCFSIKKANNVNLNFNNNKYNDVCYQQKDENLDLYFRMNNREAPNTSQFSQNEDASSGGPLKPYIRNLPDEETQFFENDLNFNSNSNNNNSCGILEIDKGSNFRRHSHIPSMWRKENYCKNALSYSYPWTPKQHQITSSSTDLSHASYHCMNGVPEEAAPMDVVYKMASEFISLNESYPFFLKNLFENLLKIDNEPLKNHLLTLVDNLAKFSSNSMEKENATNNEVFRVEKSQWCDETAVKEITVENKEENNDDAYDEKEEKEDEKEEEEEEEEEEFEDDFYDTKERDDEQDELFLSFTREQNSEVSSKHKFEEEEEEDDGAADDEIDSEDGDEEGGGNDVSEHEENEVEYDDGEERQEKEKDMEQEKENQNNGKIEKLNYTNNSLKRDREEEKIKEDMGMSEILNETTDEEVWKNESPAGYDEVVEVESTDKDDCDKAELSSNSSFPKWIEQSTNLLDYSLNIHEYIDRNEQFIRSFNKKNYINKEDCERKEEQKRKKTEDTSENDDETCDNDEKKLNEDNMENDDEKSEPRRDGRFIIPSYYKNAPSNDDEDDDDDDRADCNGSDDDGDKINDDKDVSDNFSSDEDGRECTNDDGYCLDYRGGSLDCCYDVINDDVEGELGEIYGLSKGGSYQLRLATKEDDDVSENETDKNSKVDDDDWFAESRNTTIFKKDTNLDETQSTKNGEKKNVIENVDTKDENANFDNKDAEILSGEDKGKNFEIINTLKNFRNEPADLFKGKRKSSISLVKLPKSPRTFSSDYVYVKDEGDEKEEEINFVEIEDDVEIASKENDCVKKNEQKVKALFSVEESSNERE